MKFDLTFPCIMIIFMPVWSYLLRRYDPSKALPSLLTKKSFEELKAFKTDEQERLFSESWNKAFSGWRWFVWAFVVWFFVFSCLPVSEIIDKSHWVLVDLALSLIVILSLRLWEIRYVRAFLGNSIEKFRTA